MNCPKCGDANAVLLFTSIQCSTKQCSNFDKGHATEIQMRDFTYANDAIVQAMLDWDVQIPMDWELPKNWKQTGTVTGRFKSSEPNLSNLPKKAYQSPMSPEKPSLKLFAHQIAIIDYFKNLNSSSLATYLPRIV